jgi:hypothetical protein
MIQQLNPPLPLVTPRGKADAHFVIDYGPEAHLIWVCFIRDTGECWSYQNRDVRIEPNPTLGRFKTSEIKSSALSS